MSKKMRNTLSFVLAFVMLLSVYPPAFAENSQIPSEQTAENRVVFSGLSQLAENESLQYIVTEADGTESVVGIRRVQSAARANERTWQVWYRHIGHSVEFYMTVSNNKVTSVYDYSISVVGGSYENAELTKTSTYGKLTFTLKSIGGIAASTCWLKGTVTGVDDEIETTWQM